MSRLPARSLNSRLLLAALALSFSLPAAGQDKPSQRPVVSPCVAPDPSHCPQVQERLRLENRARRPLQPIGPSAAFAPLAQGSGMMPAQLHVQGGFGRQ